MPSMTSSRPYMLRAMYQWIVDNDHTPYLLVDAEHAGVEVPPQAVKDGKVVLNLAPQAVSGMDMGNEEIVFLTRFSGASMRVRVPVAAAQAIYAQESGQGMMFQDDDPAAERQSGAGAQAEQTAPEGDDAQEPDSQTERPARGTPHLRIIK